MFTGIIVASGQLESRRETGGDVRVRIASTRLDFSDVALGDSIAVNGVCLTAIEVDADGFAADCSRETLAHTTLGALDPGATVNLEKALQVGQHLGGHLVSGHVDGIGRCVSRRDDARSVRLGFEVPDELARYIARKGSVCVDGVSLTVNEVSAKRFEVNIVPHTLAVTNVVDYREGTAVNIEVDLIARYLERLLQRGDTQGMDLEMLRRYGFAE